MPKMTAYRRRLPGARVPRAGPAACLPASSHPTAGYQPLEDVLDPSRGNGSLNASQTTNPQQLASRSGSERIRLSLLRTTNALCIILTVGPLVASTIAFCITRSPLSFVALLPVLSQVSNIRRRLEEFAFPTSQEDQQIRLKELDVELERIRKQSPFANLTPFTWLRRLLGK